MIFFKIVFVCLIGIGLYNFGEALVGNLIRSGIYACNDKHSNPPDVQQQCKRLTKGQWWSK